MIDSDNIKHKKSCKDNHDAERKEGHCSCGHDHAEGHCACGEHDHDHGGNHCGHHEKEHEKEHCSCGAHEHGSEHCGYHSEGHEKEHCSCGKHDNDDEHCDFHGGGHENAHCSCGSHDHGDHYHGEGCECCAAKGHVDIAAAQNKLSFAEFKIPLAKAAVSFVLAIIALLVQNFASGNAAFISYVCLYCAAYIVVAAEYIIKAVKGIFKKDFFNENVLMTIASIGAFAIGEYVEGVAVMLLYSIGEMLQDAAISKSKRDIVSLLDLKADSCIRLEGEEANTVDCDSLEPGDTVLVRSGEKVPSDGILLDDNGVFDYSSMTGESMPVEAVKGNEITGGVVNAGNAVKLSITKKFKDTSASKILQLVQEAQEKKPRAQKLISKFAAVYTPVVFILALAVALIPPAFYPDYGTAFTGVWLKKALVFLVISCPCALVISVPLAFFAGIGRCSRCGVLVKGGNYLEALRSVDTICFDKTGTLTRGVFEVTSVKTCEGVDEQNLKNVAAACESMSTHPLALSVMKYVGQNAIVKACEYKEYAGMGVSCVLDGKTCYAGNTKLLEKYGIVITEKYNGDESVIYIATDGRQLGYITLSDAIKDGVADVINYLQSKGKEIVILSGDNDASVKKVADTLGVSDYRSGLLPQDKYAQIEAIKQSGKKVMFVGDGLNDAPAIKIANLGVCVGGLANDASVEASDIVLSTGNIDGLPDAFATADVTARRVTQNIVFSLATKLVIMIFSLIFNPLMWLAVIADVGVCIIAVINSVRKAGSLRKMRGNS